MKQALLTTKHNISCNGKAVTFLPTLPREIVPPPKKPVFCPDGQFQGRGGQFHGSRGDNLCSPFFTPKRPPPYSTRNCPPFLPYVILSPPHFFPQGGQFQGGQRGGQFHGGGSVLDFLRVNCTKTSEGFFRMVFRHSGVNGLCFV